MHHAILNMGFYATVRIAKTRRTAHAGDIELCVDDLEGVGLFLELEHMVPDGVSALVVQRDLAAFVADLGVEAERTAETYDSLVRSAQD